jgi:hypothetical protein
MGSGKSVSRVSLAKPKFTGRVHVFPMPLCFSSIKMELAGEQAHSELYMSLDTD